MSSAQSDPASQRTETVQDHTCLQAGGHNCITEDDSISSPCNRKPCGTPETVTKEMAPH